MKAWRLYKFGDMRLDDVPMPKVRPGWVLIELRMVQPSVTEVQWSRGILMEFGAKIEKLVKEKAPFQMFGHEFCGTVVEVGEGVTNLKSGDRVFYWRRAACHKCDLCLAGYEEQCRKGPVLGIDIQGCFAEYMLLPAETLTSIPDSITDSEGAAMQPLAGVVADVHAIDVDMGDIIVILGQGVIGLNVLQVCQICGSGKIITVDVRDDVLALSSDLGADIIINANKMDPIESVLEATGGKGADIVFECAGGSPQQGLSGTKTLSQTVRVVRDGGKIMQVANLQADAALEVMPISMRGIQYHGQAFCTQKLIEYTVNLVASKRVRLTPLITHTLEGLDKVGEAFEITGDKRRYGAINPAQVKVSE
ncbi:zinc-binding dehydrogenase [Thermodesulfobacteriota bacterium]